MLSSFELKSKFELSDQQFSVHNLSIDFIFQFAINSIEFLDCFFGLLLLVIKSIIKQRYLGISFVCLIQQSGLQAWLFFPEIEGWC